MGRAAGGCAAVEEEQETPTRNAGCGAAKGGGRACQAGQCHAGCRTAVGGGGGGGGGWRQRGGSEHGEINKALEAPHSHRNQVDYIGAKSAHSDFIPEGRSRHVARNSSFHRCKNGRADADSSVPTPLISPPPPQSHGFTMLSNPCPVTLQSVLHSRSRQFGPKAS